MLEAFERGNCHQNELVPFTPYPLFQWYPQSTEILLNLSMKNSSAFNARGSRVTIVVVQVRAMKIYVTEVEALRKNERQDET
jgi:hypothetical protein